MGGYICEIAYPEVEREIRDGNVASILGCNGLFLNM